MGINLKVGVEIIMLHTPYHPQTHLHTEPFVHLDLVDWNPQYST